MGAKRVLAACLLSGICLASWPTRGEALTEFRILQHPVLTIRQPEGDTDTRILSINRRFAAIVNSTSDEKFEVNTSGDARSARILVNGSMLLEVTAEDAAANATGQAIALAEVWAQRLRAVLEKPEVMQQLLGTANLPEQILVAGRRYAIGSESVADRGQFVTDGSRAGDRVIFWVKQSETESEMESKMESEMDKVALPTPLPEQVYVLNRFRDFVPYRAL